MVFVDSKPDLETQWRGLILFGKNTATYKFAFGKSLLSIAERDISRLSIEDMAPVYAQFLIEHLRSGNKQGVSNSSTFLSALTRHIEGVASLDEMLDATRKEGFKYVIEAFQNLGGGTIPDSFYSYNRVDKSIYLSDNLFKLKESVQGPNLTSEIEARWNLVETAWNLSVPVSAVQIEAEGDFTKLIITDGANFRKPITSTRDALSGYQKGKCFYSERAIDLNSGNVDVDHFFPISKQELHLPSNLNGVWNLVLSDASQNRSKSAQAPSRRHLENLHARNEYYIRSKHPLGATILKQTGASERERISFLQRHYDISKQYSFAGWEPTN
jgi:hypothetical protein